MNDDKIQLLATIEQHRTEVRAALNTVVQDLSRRTLVHDVSKYKEDELEGFARISKVAREHVYGSEEYIAAMKQEKGTIELHYSRNSHHPEFYKENSWDMPLLDLIEMVCDWRAAWKVYESYKSADKRATWTANMEKQRVRFFEKGILNRVQWYVVEQVAALLARDDG